MRDRLRLFDAVITASVLYGCEAWTLTVDLQRRLRTTQRKMLRMILNARRRRLRSQDDEDTGTVSSQDSSMEPEETMEPWSEFLQRTARWTEEQLKEAGLKEWLESWRERQWKFAADLHTKHRGKWSYTAAVWSPALHESEFRGRRRGHPRKRWHTDFQEFLDAHFGQDVQKWEDLSKRKKQWLELSKRFVEHSCKLD